jgi:hypothetical protein
VSLGQTNTVVLCPALTSHSELGADALLAAGISPTTIRIAVGDEDPRTLLAHFIRAAQLALDPIRPGFSGVPLREIDAFSASLHRAHRRYCQAQPSMATLLARNSGAAQAVWSRRPDSPPRRAGPPWLFAEEGLFSL